MCVLYEICQFQRYKANTVFYACCSQSNLCKYDTVPPPPPTSPHIPNSPVALHCF